MERPTATQQPGGQTEGLSSLGLRVPQQSPAHPDSFLLDTKQTSAWFAALPMANIGETARQVFNALVDCNRMEMPDVLRARVTEQFREPVKYLCTNLERHYVDLGLPLSSKGAKTLALARELHAELAIGYKIIIENQLRSDKQQFDEKLLVIALHRALYHLGQMLFLTALGYGPWPPGVWREIHGIYAYAAQNQAQNVPVKDALHPRQGQSTTLEDMYKSLAVFAASDPLRLRQSQIKQIYSQVLDWARLVQIRPAESEDNAVGRFNVDLWGDMPPVHNSLNPPPQNRRARVVDLRALVSALKEEFERNPATEERLADRSDRPSRALLRLLIVYWTKPPERRFVRTHLNFELHLAVGLNAIFDGLGGLAPEQRQRPTDALGISTEDSRPAGTTSPRVPAWAAAAPGNFSLAPLDSTLTSEPLPSDSSLSLGEPKGGQRDTEWLDRGSPDTQRPPQAVTTINESAGGYCIRWNAEQTPRVKVGEVLGIQAGSGTRQFGVGLVRWLKQDPARDLEVGLEIVAARCRIGELRDASESARRSKQPRYPCLLLPESSRGAGDPSLLTPVTNLTPANDELWLRSEGREQKITLTHLVELTGTVARYEYRYARDEARDMEPREEAKGEFDDLWSSL